MIPSALSAQLQRGLRSFLEYSFESSTPGMEGAVGGLLEAPGGVMKGPYVSLKLPFQAGGRADYFPELPLGFTPHAHQEAAFDRLSGRRKRSTLVATGTGSGKTECFLLPILDHCRESLGSPGVKAILIYPMNALASDQALRLAQLIHRHPALAGVRAGLYVGQTKGSEQDHVKTMGPRELITDREVMRRDPPDILLTNYKMLDYLLLRPDDYRLWRHNGRGVLRYLVVDELHSFDGAQGTDLACLVRRLKHRLQVDDGALCCVGTSATMGGPQAEAQLCSYAGDVFGEDFEPGAVIGEARLSPEAFLASAEEGAEEGEERLPGPEAFEALDPAQADSPEAWLQTQLGLWFAKPPAAGPEGAVALGEALKRLPMFRALLVALGDRTVALDDLVAELGRARSDWLEDPELGRRVIGSLLGLVATARVWGAELPEVAAARAREGGARPQRPLCDLRMQLWQRELARMVASVEPEPKLRYLDDLDPGSQRRYLPLSHCRECGACGWVTYVQRDKPRNLACDTKRIYRAYFGRDPQVNLLYPRAAVKITESGGGADKVEPPAELVTVELDSLTVLAPGDASEGPSMQLARMQPVQGEQGRQQLSRDCPFCRAKDALSLVGFRAATLTSVYIDQLFASAFNDDKKLLTFSDSVQDAAHRAGFFGARTWRSNLRVAMLEAIQASPGLPLSELGQRVSERWEARLGRTHWLSTFLAPGMAWLHEWEELQRDPTDEAAATKLKELVKKRLDYEVQHEFGLQDRIGRSLSRTGSVAVGLDPQRLEAGVAAALPELRELLRAPDLGPVELRRAVIGLLHRLRRRGGISAQSLPKSYLRSAGEDVNSFNRAIHLPAYGKRSRLPALLIDPPEGGRFEPWAKGWYGRWLGRSLLPQAALLSHPGDIYEKLVPALAQAGLLHETLTKRGARVYGLQESALWLYSKGVNMACDRCGAQSFVPEAEAPDWEGLPCLGPSCAGHHRRVEAQGEYFRRLYAGGDLHRIFAAEHTGLLDNRLRDRVELQFKAPEPGPGVPPEQARQPWYPNLLSCTPTLEMGIDIGELSSAILCSVPPRQSSYLQRIGRAGRRDGNAFLLTVANARAHDLYFYADPEEMMAGEVSPPGVYLDAAAVLARQLTAFCFDRWVADLGTEAALPQKLGAVFRQPDGEGFPYPLLDYIERREARLLREFEEMFPDLSEGSAEQLRAFLRGEEGAQASLRWRLLDALTRERRERDSLASRDRAMADQIKRMREREDKPSDWEAQVETMEQEKDALAALVREINRRHLLEFLTDQGLLPNYEFPESSVRLRSVIWRKRSGKPQADGRRYDTKTYTYVRAPASAISELAPQAEFYAGGHRVRIDQVDVGVSKVERWRFCDQCSHAECVDAGEAQLGACPSCGSEGWADTGQLQHMLRLQQVFARSNDRDSRIKDDSDNRNLRFFQKQLLIDVRDEDRGEAWSIDDPQLPFGVELLRKATFREVNFGDQAEGEPIRVAGRSAVRPGFRICDRCGMVQEGEGAPVRHSVDCRDRERAGAERFVDCLYLYREFSSEAVRILLPMSDLSARTQLSSFTAALLLGLREHFSGSVDHLRTTLQSEPVPNTALRKQYLVLFDTVPGGTGYLKQLLTPSEEDGRLPLLDVLQSALQRVARCACLNDPERDGCYRCLYAYRNDGDMNDIRASAAIHVLERILDAQDKLQPVGSLSEVSISGLLDSVLEERFLEALRRIEDGGRVARLTPAVVRQKPGYRWSLGEAEWQVEPQVEPPPAELGGVRVSIDFVLRSTRKLAPGEAPPRPIAVFTDGWEYHKDRVAKDSLQRMALAASGAWDVCSLTWPDVDAVLGQPPAPLVDVVGDPARWRPKQVAGDLRATLPADNFGQLARWLIRGSDAPPEPERALSLLHAQMQPPDPVGLAAWDALVARAPEAVRPELEGAPKALVRSEEPCLTMMAAFGDDHRPHLLVKLADADLEDPALVPAWRGYLRALQLLSGLERLPEGQRGGLCFFTERPPGPGDDYAALARLRVAEAEAAWAELSEVGEAFRPLAEALMAAGVPEPEIGFDLPNTRGWVWAEAELLWEEAQLGVMRRQDAPDGGLPLAEGWRVLYLEELGEDPVAKIKTMLERTGGA